MNEKPTPVATTELIIRVTFPGPAPDQTLIQAQKVTELLQIRLGVLPTTTRSVEMIWRDAEGNVLDSGMAE